MPQDSKQHREGTPQNGRLRTSSRSPRQPSSRDRSNEETFSAPLSALSATPGASRSGTVSKHELVSMDDACWFRSGPETWPVRHYDLPMGVPLPFGLRAIVRPVNRPVGESMPCFLIFKHSEIRIEQNFFCAAPTGLPLGSVQQRLRYPQVTFMGELTPIEGPGVVLRFCDEENNESVVVEVSGMTRSVAETIRSILEARGSPMYIADW